MTKTAPISYAGLKLVKTFEGFRANATLLPNGIWVIGHGHTVSAKKGGLVDEQDAETLLIWDMSQLAPKVTDSIFAPVSQAQMDALLSLAFNIGIENFVKSDVVRYINEGNILSAAAAFDIWRKASLGGREMVVDALVRRRTAEKARFLDVEQGIVLAPSARLQPKNDTHLAETIEEESEDCTNDNDTVEVSIDLSNSAALGSLISAENMTEDAVVLSLDPSLATQPDFIYSDDDNDGNFENVANGNQPVSHTPSPKDEVEDQKKTEEKKETLEAKPTPKLVPLDDVFSSTETPIREVAENISGRLAAIAVELDEPQTQMEPPELQIEPVAEQQQDTLPPMPDDGEKETTEDAEFDDDILSLDFTNRVFEDVPPVMDEAYESELSPQSLSNELSSTQDQPFEVLEKRNTGMFILMGITGLILGAGGIFETSKSGVVVTLGDMLKGPGLAGFGILLVLVALYFLLSKPKK